MVGFNDPQCVPSRSRSINILVGYPRSKPRPRRRIPLNQLIRFMKQHGMPLNGLMTGCTRILIVDDEQDIVEVLEKILEDEAKYEVEVARSGFAAGVTAEKFRPHVILLDMHLKDIDAPEVAKQVKKNPDLQLTKVIAMSGKLTEAEAQGLPPPASTASSASRSTSARSSRRSKTRWPSSTKSRDATTKRSETGSSGGYGPVSFCAIAHARHAHREALGRRTRLSGLLLSVPRCEYGAKLMAVRHRLLGDLDLDRLLNAGAVQTDSRFVAMRLDNQRQRVPQILAALVERPALADRAGDLFHPSDEPAVLFRFDDGVIALFHTEHFAHIIGRPSRQMPTMHTHEKRFFR